jgi:hypothetical protein
MFATKLKVAFALFLSSFIVWLILIFLVAQPTGSVGQIQFSDFAPLALFLGSAITASLSSMVIGLNFIGLMKPISLKKSLGEVKLPLRRENHHHQFNLKNCRLVELNFRQPHIICREKRLTCPIVLFPLVTPKPFLVQIAARSSKHLC